MAGMYTVYHGAEGIKSIAQRIHAIATYINELLPVYDFSQENENFFDTLKITLPESIALADFRKLALEYEVNFRYFETGEIGISFDETTDIDDVNTLIEIFATAADNAPVYANEEDLKDLQSFDETLERQSTYLTYDVFGKYPIISRCKAEQNSVQ
jgi:glycine dehydrogenase